MESVSIIGLDLAKRFFQAHGADRSGKKLFSKKLVRGQVLDFFRKLEPCIVAMEACSSSHYWGRQIRALGHEVRLIAPQYVKPFVKRGKNDANDAEAISEAAVRPNMRFVDIRSAKQHSQAMVFRGRDLLVGQRTALINAVRGHCAEFGIHAATGDKGFEVLKAMILAAKEKPHPDFPEDGVEVLLELVGLIDHLTVRIDAFDVKMSRACKGDGLIKALMTIPGIGPITALAIRALGPDAKGFASGRDYAAWMGLVPRQNSSGGKTMLGRITKKGNRTLRRLLIICANSVITSVKRKRSQPSVWLAKIIDRLPGMKAITALANKLARIVWALQVRGGIYEARQAI
jgi:transposase